MKIKMEAPFKKIAEVGYDLYIILIFAKEDVSVTEINEKGEKQEFKNNLFHIGFPEGDGYNQREKLAKLIGKE